MKKIVEQALRLTVAALLLFPANSLVVAQSGGGFQITEAVIAPGGGQSSAGGVTVDGTVGQTVAAGPIGAGPFGVTSGFWNFVPLIPTAAQVSIAGRVVDPSGDGVPNAILYMHLQDGQLRMSRSSPFGYFEFEGVEVGQTVLVSVRARLYTYTPRVVTVAEEIADLNFVPESKATTSEPEAK